MTILRLLIACSLAVAAPVSGGEGSASAPASDASPATARYSVRMLPATPATIAVTATMLIDGDVLAMSSTRPAGIPELDASGWPGLIAGLQVTDAVSGEPVEVTAGGDAGWRLNQPRSGALRLSYEVDYSSLKKLDWPAPREAGFADGDHFVTVGRSLFITTPNTGSSVVTFDLPKGWQAVTPWSSRTAGEYTVESDDLTENLLAFTRTPPEVIRAGGFTLLVTPMGHWQKARAEVRRVLEPVIPRLVRLMKHEGRGNYLVVLLPMVERGGESYRGSFAMTTDAEPTSANSAAWGNTIAHEIFHYWNGWRLRGSDYAASQWFQEGFTEYVANVSMASTGVMTPDEFLQKLATHVANYRKLATTLEAPGNRKGPPLYSGGALVAFSWDVMIREATGGRRTLADVFQHLWSATEGGDRPYGWSDIHCALQATTPLQWEPFFLAHIRGNEPLPLASIFLRAGLQLIETGESPRVTADPTTLPPSRSLWSDIVRTDPET